MNIQNRNNFFTAGAHAIKKIEIFRSCSRFKTIPQLFSTIEIFSIVVTIFGISFEGGTVAFVAEMSLKMFILRQISLHLLSLTGCTVHCNSISVPKLKESAWSILI